jgi:hypothetical protein
MKPGTEFDWQEAYNERKPNASQNDIGHPYYSSFTCRGMNSVAREMKPAQKTNCGFGSHQIKPDIFEILHRGEAGLTALCNSSCIIKIIIRHNRSIIPPIP